MCRGGHRRRGGRGAEAALRRKERRTALRHGFCKPESECDPTLRAEVDSTVALPSGGADSARAPASRPTIVGVAEEIQTAPGAERPAAAAPMRRPRPSSRGLRPTGPMHAERAVAGSALLFREQRARLHAARGRAANRLAPHRPLAGCVGAASGRGWRGTSRQGELEAHRRHVTGDATWGIDSALEAARTAFNARTAGEGDAVLGRPSAARSDERHSYPGTVNLGPSSVRRGG